jgi:2-keto-4-pentenoate hydratase
MGVNEPDYGTLWESRWIKRSKDSAEVPITTFLQPRVEGEIAFLLGELPDSSECSVDQVLAATRAIAPAIEIVDSRITDWRIKLADTVADNASYGGFVLGEWVPVPAEQELAELPMALRLNGEIVAQGVGAAALGNPACAVAWLLDKMHSLEVTVQPGDIILSGALAATVPAAAGDIFTLILGTERPLDLAFR